MLGEGKTMICFGCIRPGIEIHGGSGGCGGRCRRHFYIVLDPHHSTTTITTNTITTTDAVLGEQCGKGGQGILRRIGIQTTNPNETNIVSIVTTTTGSRTTSTSSRTTCSMGTKCMDTLFIHLEQGGTGW